MKPKCIHNPLINQYPPLKVTFKKSVNISIPDPCDFALILSINLISCSSFNSMIWKPHGLHVKCFIQKIKFYRIVYPLPMMIRSASRFPYRAAKWTGVIPSSSTAFMSRFVPFFNTSMHPSIAPLWNRVAAGDVIMLIRPKN